MANFGRVIEAKPAPYTSAAAKVMASRLREFGKTIPHHQRMTFFRDCVLETETHELLPLALEYLTDVDATDTHQIIKWIRNTLQEQDFLKLLVSLGLSSGASDPSAWVESLADNRHAHPIGEREYLLIRESPNMIARLAAASLFPDCLTPEGAAKTTRGSRRVEAAFGQTKA